MIHQSPSQKIALLLCLFGLISSAQAQWIETVEFVPTRSVVAVPRTYLFETSVLMPPLSPTVRYVESGYYAVPQTVVYRTVRPRRLFERTYIASDRVVLRPTYYLAPTTYVTTSGMIASAAALCCETADAPITPRALPKETRSTAIGVERAPMGTIESSVVGGEGAIVRDDGVQSTGGSAAAPDSSARTALPSSAKAPAATEIPKKSIPSTVDVPKTEPKKSEVATPAPAPPKPGPKPSEGKPEAVKPAVNPEPAKTGAAVAIPPPADPATRTPPSPPLPEPDVVPPLEIPAPSDPKDGETTRRSAMKPVIPAIGAPPRATRNVLQGKIVSADSQQAEEGVEVVLADRSARFLDRTTKTDAFGRFALSLPDGDWTIKVTMPSGRVLAVGQGAVTATSGKVLDMYGRNLTNLVIQR